MSKIVMSLPDGMIKGGCIGAAVSLICYALLQLLVAFLICEEIIGEEMLRSAVCISAGVSSFVGCWCGAVRSKKGTVFSAVTVVSVFFVLTLLIGFLLGELGVNGDILVGVGTSMSVGGLVAAFICGARGNRVGSRVEKGKRRREKRSGK